MGCVGCPPWRFCDRDGGTSGLGFLLSHVPEGPAHPVGLSSLAGIQDQVKCQMGSQMEFQASDLPSPSPGYCGQLRTKLDPSVSVCPSGGSSSFQVNKYINKSFFKKIVKKKKDCNHHLLEGKSISLAALKCTGSKIIIISISSTLKSLTRINHVDSKTGSRRTIFLCIRKHRARHSP